MALLFCGITLKHYAYYNMSRRTQLTTKFMFQVLAQLSENFIFIYLGLTLFTENKLVFKPLFILVTVFGICAARYAAVFPLSKLINWVIRVRARRKGLEVADELPHSYQVMLFWAGLRGAVGVALAAGMPGNPENVKALQATVLTVVVLTVIIFGGTTARMLEIMGIRTGVVEEVDSDDEFDIETTTNSTYYKRGGNAVGYTPRQAGVTARPLSMDRLKRNGQANGGVAVWESGYSSGSSSHSPPVQPNMKRSASNLLAREREAAGQGLIGQPEEQAVSPSDDGFSDTDLPPMAPRRSPKRKPSPPPPLSGRRDDAPPTAGPAHGQGETAHITATGALRELFAGTDDAAGIFKRLDEGLFKPHLLLDQSNKGDGSGQV